MSAQRLSRCMDSLVTCYNTVDDIKTSKNSYSTFVELAETMCWEVHKAGWLKYWDSLSDVSAKYMSEGFRKSKEPVEAVTKMMESIFRIAVSGVEKDRKFHTDYAKKQFRTSVENLDRGIITCSSDKDVLDACYGEWLRRFEFLCGCTNYYKTAIQNATQNYINNVFRGDDDFVEAIKEYEQEVLSDLDKCRDILFSHINRSGVALFVLCGVTQLTECITSVIECQHNFLSKLHEKSDSFNSKCLEVINDRVLQVCGGTEESQKTSLSEKHAFQQMSDTVPPSLVAHAASNRMQPNAQGAINVGKLIGSDSITNVMTQQVIPPAQQQNTSNSTRDILPQRKAPVAAPRKSAFPPRENARVQKPQAVPPVSRANAPSFSKEEIVDLGSAKDLWESRNHGDVKGMRGAVDKIVDIAFDAKSESDVFQKSVFATECARDANIRWWIARYIGSIIEAVRVAMGNDWADSGMLYNNYALFCKNEIYNLCDKKELQSPEARQKFLSAVEDVDLYKNYYAIGQRAGMNVADFEAILGRAVFFDTIVDAVEEQLTNFWTYSQGELHRYQTPPNALDFCLKEITAEFRQRNQRMNAQHMSMMTRCNWFATKRVIISKTHEHLREVYGIFSRALFSAQTTKRAGKPQRYDNFSEF